MGIDQTKPEVESPQTTRLEIAHVLFTDIVGYSRLPMDQQTAMLSQLQQIVRGTSEFQQAQADGQLISLPTGDGMALVFFGSPEMPVQCAFEISRALQAQPDLKLRMGVHTGPIYRVVDINANMNVAGGGINMAQRVMDCGDSGHILVSDQVAKTLGQLSTWAARLHDLGEVEVKHGVRVHVYNLYTKELGNPEPPEKFRRKVEESAHQPTRKSAFSAIQVDPQSLKQDLELAGKLERPAQLYSENSATATGTNARMEVKMDGSAAESPTGAIEAAPTGTSSSEYFVREIKRHKRSALLALAVLIVATAGVALWLDRFINLRRSNTPLVPAKVRHVGMPPLKIIPLTSFAALEVQPAFSPDGDRVAFGWNGEKGDNFDIYVKLIDAGTPLRLTTNPNDDLAPVWSPNGRDIAFVRYSESERSIFKVSALGGPERKLYSVTEAGFPTLRSGLSWSQDGKLLAFSSKAAPHEPNSIYLLSFETDETRKLTSPPAQYEGDSKPTFAPDGQTLAFIRWSVAGVNDIYLVPTAGGEPKRLTFDNRVVQGIAWTPDGQEIVFSSRRASTYSLWRLSASGGTPEPMPIGAGNISSLAISRQGQRLVYTKEFADTNIWRIQIPSSTGSRDVPTQLISSTLGDVSPQYSPDGTKIVFASGRSGSYEIWMCDTGGLNPVQLTFFGGPEVGSPRWSPDGQQIVFDYTTEERHRDIYVVSVEGGRPRDLTVGPSNDVRPSWSKDGRWIYFGSNRGGDYQVWKVPAEEGQAVQVTKQGGLEAFESPDGRFVYYAKGSDALGIWRTPAEGGEEIRIHDHIRLGHWALLDQGIYFLNPKAHPRSAIEFFNFATSHRTQIATIEKELLSRVPSLAVSPDRRQILYVQIDQRESDIMLVENFR